MWHPRIWDVCPVRYLGRSGWVTHVGFCMHEWIYVIDFYICTYAKTQRNTKTGAHVFRWTMAQLKATPIKVYGKSVSNSKSMCRLCCSIYEPKYTKKPWEFVYFANLNCCIKVVMFWICLIWIQNVNETHTSDDPASSNINLSFRSVPFTDILNTINDELRKVAARDIESVLRQRGFEGLSSFSLENIMDEIKTLCPVSFRVLSEMSELSYNKEKKISPLWYMGVIMFKRCHEMSCLQRIKHFYYPTVMLTQRYIITI